MEKKKVLVFGDLPLSTKVVQYLAKLERINIVGVVAYPRKKQALDYFDCESLYDFAMASNIKVFTLEELLQCFAPGSLDFGVLTRFSKIIKIPIINLFSERILNFHGGLLPEFAGPNSCCHEILTGSKFAGGTLHLITDETADTGDILKICQFDILATDTAETVFKKTNKALYDGFVEISEQFFFGEPTFMAQSSLIESGHQPHYYWKTDLQHELVMDEPTKKVIATHARGFDFPGHERGYVVYNGQKIYFTTKNLEYLEMRFTSLGGGGKHTIKSATSYSELYAVLATLSSSTFWASLLRGEFSWYAEKLFRLANCLILYDAQMLPIGTISFYANDEAGAHAFLSNIVISDDYQHMGLGALLVNIATEISVASGMKTMSVHVHTENFNAQRFYNKMGFKCTWIVEQEHILLIKNLFSVEE